MSASAMTLREARSSAHALEAANIPPAGCPCCKRRFYVMFKRGARSGQLARLVCACGLELAVRVP